MVKSISKAVQELIDGNLSLQEALQYRYGNYSAIARMLKPKVEAALGRRVKLESVITSVKRASVSYRAQEGDLLKVIAGSTINLRTDVAKISVEKTRRTLETIRRFLANFTSEFLQVLEGTSAVTLIADQKLFHKIVPMFSKDDILDERRGLAAIIVHSPKEIIKTPGCAIAFYSPVSRRQLNIEETMSCFTDTIIVLRMEDVGKAFAALTDLITEARSREAAARR